MRKTRILCGLLVLALLLSLLPTLAAAAPKTLEEPAETKFRFNGHAVTDRSSFALNASDWTLGTFTDSPAVIRSGRTAGIGMEYRRALPERWYAQISVQPASGDNAGIALSGGGRQLVVQAGADNVLRAALDEQNILEQPLTGSGTLTFVFDNTLGGEALGLYIWQGEQYCGGWELTEPDKALLGSVTSIGFYAEQAGTIFSNFGVNTMIYAYENDPAAALAQVEAWAQQEVVGSIVKADNGVNMYTPDGVKNYDALWTRDFTYMLRYAGEYIPVSDAVACIEYLLENVHEGDCWLPDRVYGNGRVNYAAGDMDLSRANLDNNAFIVIAMDCALSRMSEAEGKALFEKWETTLMTALDALPKDENGLVYNDPLNPHSPYGFTDCICKTGSLMKESLLLWEAWCIMAKWQTAFGHDASVATAGAKSIEAVLVDTFRNSDGMLDAATVDCHQSDIWGSCYAVSIGFPLDESLKKSIADYIAANYCGLVQMGQLRHTAPGTYWQKLLSGVTPGEYQNGAYWATPTGWLIDTLEPYYPDLAMETLQDLISYYAAEGIYECVNGDYRKLIHYAASASNVLPAARRLLTTSPDLTGLELIGAQTAVVGAEKTYTLKLTPENVKITSYAWTANGTACGNGAELTLRFAEAGETVLTCTATDLNGNALTASLTVTVTQPDYPAITLTAGAISGRAGDTVAVPYRLSSASGLAAAEFTLEYDAAQLEYVGMQSDLTEVCSAHPAEDGRVKVVLATAEPLTAEGTLLTAQFRLKQDVKTAYALPAFDTALCDYRDDSGTHPAQITVAQELVPPTQYTVTFVDGLTNETIATVEVEEGHSATAPEAPEHEGYTFKGWDKAFDNVTENLTVTAIYEKNNEPEKPWANPFKDVKETDWFYEGVKFANQHELFNGTAPDTFSPDDAMTRAMLVTVLWRLDGKTEAAKSSAFVDVPTNEYYTEAVAWAAENGIVNGVDATHFAPNDEVTREQIAAILSRYAEKKGVDTTKRANLTTFPDANKVSAYAKDALAWANAAELIKGTNENGQNYLAPAASATRAQVATILACYAQNIVK